MIRRFCLAIGMAALCFNVSAKTKPLPMPLAPELPVEIVMNQHELAVDVPETATAMGAQFGLIVALIGSAIQNSQVKKAEERAAPIRDRRPDSLMPCGRPLDRPFCYSAFTVPLTPATHC